MHWMLSGQESWEEGRRGRGLFEITMAPNETEGETESGLPRNCMKGEKVAGTRQNRWQIVQKVSGLMQGLSLAAKTFLKPIEVLREKDSFDSRTVSRTH